MVGFGEHEISGFRGRGYRRNGACEGNRIQEVGCMEGGVIYGYVRTSRSVEISSDEETRPHGQSAQDQRGTRDAVRVWGEHTPAETPRRQIPLKPLGVLELDRKRRQKPRTCVGGSTRALLIGL